MGKILFGLLGNRNDRTFHDRKVARAIALALTTCSILWFSTLLFVTIGFENFNSSKSHEDDSFNSEILHIALVSCINKSDLTNSNNVTIETLTLIKSVLISAKIHESSFERKIEFHIFINSNSTKLFLADRITGYHQKIRGDNHFPEIAVNFYSTLKAVPTKGYQEGIEQSTQLECSFVRMFLHNALPKRISKVLYLDTDNIVTGNIWTLWRTKLCYPQAIAMAQNNEQRDKNYGHVDNHNFNRLPVVPPKGVNAGVMLMDLDALREMKTWTRNLIFQYEKYRRIGVSLNGQQLINSILYYNFAMLKILPCHYNFQYIHCEMGLTCWDGNEDPEGIQIIHGAGNVFHYEDRCFRKIYLAYRDFDVETQSENIMEHLIQPLKNRYNDACNGTLGKLLYKSLI